MKHPILWLQDRPKLSWTLAFGYMAVIFVLSSFPYGPPQPTLLKPISATFKHFLEYSVLGFILLACFRSSPKTRNRALLFAFLLAAFYGLTDEFHQLFVPGRTASFVDIAADSLGAFAGALISKPSKGTKPAHKKLFKRSHL
ncbi:MAG: VanZ family protein [archaeon]